VCVFGRQSRWIPLSLSIPSSREHFFFTFIFDLAFDLVFDPTSIRFYEQSTFDPILQ